MALDLFGEFGAIGGFNAAASRYFDIQSCINFYPELSPSKRAKEVAALLGAPGLVQVAAAPGGGAPGFSPSMTAWPKPSSVTNLPVRALWVLPGETEALAVIADTLYLVEIVTPGSSTSPGALSLTAVGTLATSSGPVAIRDNGAQGGTALIVDGPNGYTYQWLTNTFAQVENDNFLGAGALAFIDGWFVLGGPYPALSPTPVAGITLTVGADQVVTPRTQYYGYAASPAFGTLNSSTTVGTVTGFYSVIGLGGSWETWLTISVASDPTQSYFGTLAGTPGTLQSAAATYTYTGGVATWIWSQPYFTSGMEGDEITFSLADPQGGPALFYTPQAPYSTTWNASYYAFKDAFSDELVTLREMKELLWLIGEQTSEPWYNAGAQYFTFQRLSGAMLQIGCKAAASLARITHGGQTSLLYGEDSLIWFGRSDRGENQVILLTGLTYQIVSTPAIENIFATYATTADAIGWTYHEDGHEFYMLTFPTEDTTWCYDPSMPPDLAWTQRLAYDPYAQAWHRHRGACFMNFGGMRIVGDYENGALYQLTRAVQNEAGWPLRAVRRAPHIWKREDRRRVFLSSLQLDFAPGQGASSGLGANPVANLRISRDGGTTFGQSWPASLGAIGQYQNRCMWRRLGWGRDNVAELEVIAPVNRDLVGATLKLFGEG